jgi:hypothetical protein
MKDKQVTSCAANPHGIGVKYGYIYAFHMLSLISVFLELNGNIIFVQ